MSKKKSPGEVRILMAAAAAEIRARMQVEDALFERYLALPNRPKLGGYLRTTEVSEPQWCDDLIDWDHWQKWKRGEPDGN